MKSWLTVILTKIFVKAVVLTESIYTLIKRGIAKDPTALISEIYPAIKDTSTPDPLRLTGIKIGVVVPFRDRWEMTLSCLKSLERQQIDRTVTLNLYLVNNGSSASETLDGLKEYKNRYSKSSLSSIKVLDLDIPFNFSILCNKASVLADNDGCSHVLLLNNDIEFQDSSTIQHMLNTMLTIKREGLRVGAIGCTLLYPNRIIQHLYVAPGVKIIAAHPGKGMKFDQKQVWHAAPRQVPAVTGALMLTSVEAWLAVGGLDENLPSSGQDVDYCMKLTRKNYSILVPGRVCAIHKEGVSRGNSLCRRDVQYMYDRWPELWLGSQSALSHWSEVPLLRLISKKFPWEFLVIP